MLIVLLMCLVGWGWPNKLNLVWDTEIVHSPCRHLRYFSRSSHDGKIQLTAATVAGLARCARGAGNWGTCQWGGSLNRWLRIRGLFGVIVFVVFLFLQGDEGTCRQCCVACVTWQDKLGHPAHGPDWKFQLVEI
jgi:hypothetical protein